MTPEIKSITTPFIFNVSVNCYLVAAGDGYILVDTGRAAKRSAIEDELVAAGLQPGDLRLIILTHGDFDHSGNAAYFRQTFGAKIAMHPDDVGMVEFGDMTWNRRKPNVLVRALFALLFRLPKSDRFSPDVLIEEGDDLSEYGLEALIVELPGHSKGSIGVLASDGALFCGDLLANVGEPAVWSIIDDQAAAEASVEKLKGYAIQTVYPGHGQPFPIVQFERKQRQQSG